MPPVFDPDGDPVSITVNMDNIDQFAEYDEDKGEIKFSL